MRIHQAFCCITLLLLCSCSGTDKKTSPSSDHIGYKPAYAHGFSISETSAGNSSIRVTNPWQGADDISTSLFISKNGEKPADGFTGCILPDSALRIVAMSSTHVAMLEAIGCADRIVGVSGIDYLSSPYINSHLSSVKDVGYEGNVDYELLLSLNPDIVLIYGVNGSSIMEKKLKELKIPYMYVGDYLEESPLGKAEWIVALSEITGRRQTGISTFAHIDSAYCHIANLIRANTDSISQPKVIVNIPYGDTWYMPSTNNYMTTLITDAGGQYISAGQSGNASATVDTETAFAIASSADVWFNPGNASSLAFLRESLPRFANTPPVLNGMVFNNTLRATPGGGNDFYESGIVNPHLILSDCAMILHPELKIDSVFHYYKQLK